MQWIKTFKWLQDRIAKTGFSHACQSSSESSLAGRIAMAAAAALAPDPQPLPCFLTCFLTLPLAGLV